MIWCSRPTTFIPFPFFGLCRTEADLSKALKKLKISDPCPFKASSGANASTHTFEWNESDVVCIVTLGSTKGFNRHQIYGLLAHEAMHVWQKTREMIGEKEPSSEFEAYSMQFICTQLFKAYEELKK